MLIITLVPLHNPKNIKAARIIKSDSNQPKILTLSSITSNASNLSAQNPQ